MRDGIVRTEVKIDGKASAFVTFQPFTDAEFLGVYGADFGPVSLARVVISRGLGVEIDGRRGASEVAGAMEVACLFSGVAQGWQQDAMSSSMIETATRISSNVKADAPDCLRRGDP